MTEVERVRAALLSEERFSAEEALLVRLALDLTQEQLAERMGRSRKAVGEWESGRQRISRVDDGVLHSIAVATLFGGVEGFEDVCLLSRVRR